MLLPRVARPGRAAGTWQGLIATREFPPKATVWIDLAARPAWIEWP